MKYVLTKASDENFMEIVDYDLEQINALVSAEAIIMKTNWFYDDPSIIKFVNKHKPREFYDEVTKIPLEIMIYDAYIE